MQPCLLIFFFSKLLWQDVILDYHTTTKLSIWKYLIILMCLSLKYKQHRTDTFYNEINCSKNLTSSVWKCFSSCWAHCQQDSTVQNSLYTEWGYWISERLQTSAFFGTKARTKNYLTSNNDPWNWNEIFFLHWLLFLLLVGEHFPTW